MISQQRFEELVAMGRKGGLHVNEAIKLAVHESVDIERARVFDLVADEHLKRFEKSKPVKTVGFKEQKAVKNEKSTA